MNYHGDYYKILQVHYMAEPEIIESSYRRLAKKYHPDVNKNITSEMMKKINEAYEVLRDPDSRRRYHSEWVKKHNKYQHAHKTGIDMIKGNEKSIYLAKVVLAGYFNNLLGKNFENAYNLITRNDRKCVSERDFIRWQSTVAKVYRLEKFDCTVRNINKNMQNNGKIYKEAIDFYIVVEEYNAVMDRFENDYLIKTVVFENGIWRILLGYDGLQPLILKFEKLVGLITVKSVINELIETHSKIDTLTGLFNRKGFMEMAERETYRHNRYGNIFSLIICEAGGNEIINGNKGQYAKDDFIKWMGGNLRNKLRKLDIVGRLFDTVFVILLPETDIEAGIRAIKKLQRLFLKCEFVYCKKSYTVTMTFGIVEYSFKTIEECLKKAMHYMGVGRRLGGNKIVSREGID